MGRSDKMGAKDTRTAPLSQARPPADPGPESTESGAPHPLISHPYRAEVGDNVYALVVNTLSTMQ
jgi:hypothetical protein